MTGIHTFNRAKTWMSWSQENGQTQFISVWSHANGLWFHNQAGNLTIWHCTWRPQFRSIKFITFRIEINSAKLKPSESMLRTLFEVFGPLRSVDIPMLDPYRPKMVTNPPNTFAFGQDGLFEAFIQYQEYVGFVKCMTAFRGMKLLYKEGDRAWTAVVQVTQLVKRRGKFRYHVT